ncbi:thioredoxin family protein [Planctomicrobium sp. SH661]|uniref:thioredoxin family protein n=1 Tax=Planctomicrobium sp. SH661 TaxID=3448124 RepID=UPI003F5C74C2
MQSKPQSHQQPSEPDGPWTSVLSRGICSNFAFFGLSFFIIVSDTHSGENFRCADAEMQRVAEQARIRSARFWTGNDLPGAWSSPCPIQFSYTNHAGCGSTRFQMHGGEVFGWRMEVAGTREAILRDVIPHEVDHMVRASLTRKGIERWLDEGCAVLMESPQVHEHLRSIASKLDPAMITLDWLEGRNYPPAGQIQQLYAMGFSLAEFLLERGSPSQLLEFQRDPAGMTVRLQRHYNLNVESLRSGWLNWMRSDCRMRCAEGRCRLHPPTGGAPFPLAGDAPRPVLVIWTSEGCPPCQKFKQDFEQDSAFRERILSGFQLKWQNFDLHQSEASALGITNLPTFTLPQKSWSGYQDAADFLSKLGLNKPEPPASPGGVSTQSSIVGPPEASSPIHSNQNPPEPKPEQRPGWTILQWVPVTLSALQWAGVIGGSVATGGLGGAALATALCLFRLHRSGRSHSQKSSERSGAAVSAPFPRQLDEAGELLELRQTEGRVATLDTLRGMFLDDELEKLRQREPSAAQLAENLRQAIDARVDEVAPLTTVVRG